MTIACVNNQDKCYSCEDYTAAFACLKKVKVSEMNRLTELDIDTLLTSKCSDILLLVSSIECAGVVSTAAISVKELVQFIKDEVNRSLTNL